MDIQITTNNNEPKGYRVDGTPAGNLLNLGWVVEGNGDIDGDGIEDFIMSAPGAAGNTGKLYAAFGSADLADPLLSPTEMVALNSFLSPQVSLALGDINGDGNDDIIIGDPTADGGAKGRVSVIFGDSSRNIATNVSSLSGTNGFTILNNDSSVANKLGSSVSSGNIDGDISSSGHGIDDVIIGDPFSGKVYVLFGKASFSPVFDINTALSPSEVLTLNGTPGSQAGFSVASGNIGGDAKDDIIFGAPFAGGGLGEANVVFGNASRSSIGLTSDFTFTTTTPGGVLGFKVDSAGDINGDNYDDLIVTEPGGSGTQRSYVVFGNPTAVTLGAAAINGLNGFYVDGFNADDAQFEAISAAGDVNNDGIDDFLIAEPFSDIGVSNSGQVLLIYGKSGGFGPSASLNLPLGPNEWRSVDIDGLTANSLTGFSLSDAGDVNNDGIADFLIGAPGANNGDGTVYVVLGAPTDKPIPETTVDINPYGAPYPLIGEKRTFIVNFDNVAESPGNVGYAPFVNLFLDTSGVDGEALGVAYDGLDLMGNGSKVGIRYILDSDVDEVLGSGGTLTTDGRHSVDLSELGITPIARPVYFNGINNVVNHPYAGTIIAPTEFQPGDTLYVFDLPQGSFSPDQTIARFEVDVQIDEFADYNEALNIGTSGGFRYGANPLLDPNPPDPILDDTITSDTLTPLLYRIRKTGPYETVTGPNFERQYNISVDVAPWQTVGNLIIEDTLPDNVQFVSASGSNTPGGTATTSTPGGTVNVNAGTVTGAAGTDAHLNVRFHVPLKDAPPLPQDVLDPNTGLDSTTGKPVTSTDVAEVSPTLTWNPLDPLDDPFVGTFVEPDASFTHWDRAIAVQKSVNSFNPAQDNKVPGLSPGDIVEHVVKFQISDYFAFENLMLNDVFSDGQIFVTDPAFAPTFEVYEHNQLSSGTFTVGTDATFTNPSGGGNGTIKLQLSDVLSHPTVGGNTPKKLLGGYVDDNGGYLPFPPNSPFSETQGTIKFYTQIREDFTNPSVDQSVDNGDFFWNTATLTGDILDVPTLTNTPATQSVGDGGSRSFRLPRGKFNDYEVSIYDITDSLGNPRPDTTVTAGDLVTYRIEYEIPFADIEKLNFTSELPLPVFNLASFDTNSIDPFSGGAPPVDTISYGPNDTLSSYYGSLNPPLNPPGSLVAPPSVSVSDGHILKVDYGTFDDPATFLNPVNIDLLYTVKVQDQPLEPGLLLNNLIHKRERSTNAGSSNYTKYARIELAQPVLNIQKGVVATKEPKAVFSEFFPVTGSPSNIQFTIPGSSGPRFSGTISSDLLDTTDYFDSDVTADLSDPGANNGKEDLVTFAILVENTGPRDAFDVLIREDGIPTGFQLPSNPNGLNLRVTDGAGNPLAYTGDLFSTGIELVDSGSGAIAARNSSSGDNVAVITYDLEVQDVQPNGNVLANAAILEEYSDSNGGNKFLAGALSRTDGARVKTQPYLHEQMLKFASDFSGDLKGKTLPFNAFDYLRGGDLDYDVVVTWKPPSFFSSPSEIYNSISGLHLVAQNPLEINPNILDFAFKTPLWGFAGDYTVTVSISDPDSTNNVGDFDVQDSFTFTIDYIATVINNYVANAEIFFDGNDNGVQDPGEEIGITDENGVFTIETDLSSFDTNNNGILDPEEGRLVAIGGINTANGLPLSIALEATPDASVLTILTTVLSELVAQGSTVADANTAVTTAFSLPNTVLINHFDPIAATNNGLANGVETYEAHTQVQIAISLMNALLEGATGGVGDVADAVVAAVAAQVATGSPLDLTDVAQLETLINDAATGLGVDVSGIATGAAEIVAAANQAVEDAVVDLPATALEEEFARIEKVALGEIVKDLQAVGAGDKSIADAVAENTGAPLDDQIAAAQVFSADPTDISLSNDTVAEDQPIGTEVGTFSTVDPDTGETHTYSLVSGAGDTDNDKFEIVDNRLVTKESFDRDAQDSYSIRVLTSDGNGGIYSEDFTIDVTPNIAEEPPQIAVQTLVDANGDGIFNETETGSAGDSVKFQLTITNNGDTAAEIEAIANDILDLDSVFRGNFVGQTIAAGDSITATFMTTLPDLVSTTVGTADDDTLHGEQVLVSGEMSVTAANAAGSTTVTETHEVRVDARDTIAGDLGEDAIFGSGADDILRGDLNQRDAQVGIGHDDIIHGGAGNDRIGGKGGNDQLFGDEGDDQIWGDDGDDLLRGGLGNDILTGDDFSGGQGSDTFVLAEGEGKDTIVDFEIGVDFIGLADGLTLGQLDVMQVGNDTWIGLADGSETLAMLNGVDASDLLANQDTAFVTV